MPNLGGSCPLSCRCAVRLAAFTIEPCHADPGARRVIATPFSLALSSRSQTS
jgi:hypothetical protein